MSDKFQSLIGGEHEDWGAWQKVIIHRLDFQDKNIQGIGEKLESVNKVRESQHTENQIAFTRLNDSLGIIKDKVEEVEGLRKWLTISILAALLTAVLNLVIKR